MTPRPKTAYGLIGAAVRNMRLHPETYHQNHFCGTAYCRAGHLMIAAGRRVNMRLMSFENVLKIDNGAERLLGKTKPVYAVDADEANFYSDIERLFAPSANPNHVRTGVAGLLVFRDKWATRLRRTLVK